MLTMTPTRHRLSKITEAADELRISRALVYREIAAGRLKSVKIGGAARITSEELDRYVDALATQAG